MQMLPSYLSDPTKRKNERLNQTRLGDAPPPPLPSLCVTGALSRIGRYQVVTHNKSSANGEGRNEYTTCEEEGASTSKNSENTTILDNNGMPIILSYCIFRPRQLHDQNKPPLLCLHGGPSIPSNYLLPIVNGVTDRAVIFYDQWGCGKSSRPQLQTKNDSKNASEQKMQHPPFSIPTMVEHLRQLIDEHWKLKRFHLLGHSFGGILAYEYLRNIKIRGEDSSRLDRSCPCSLILSSAPTSAELFQSESERLFKNLNADAIDDAKYLMNDCNDASVAGDTDSCNQINERRKHQLRQYMKSSEEFRQTHECRLSNPPLCLTDALAQIGPTPWRGIDAINGYEAEGKIDDRYQIPSLLVRGQYDFCTDRCMKEWKERIWSPVNEMPEPTEKVLSNCSHYAMLEDEDLYGEEILNFVRLHDTF